MDSKQIENSIDLIAYCGLYCASCKQYLKGKCPGCKENQKASWCKIRTCCIDNNFISCADCREFDNPKACKKYHNFVARLIELAFRSDRSKSIAFIKEYDYQAFADKMTMDKVMSFKKGRS